MGRTAGTPCIVSWGHGGRQPCSSYAVVVKGLEPSRPSPAAQLLGLPWKLGLPAHVSGLLGVRGGLFTGQKPFRQWEEPRLQHGGVAGWQDPSPGQAYLYAEQPTDLEQVCCRLVLASISSPSNDYGNTSGGG